MRKLRLILLLTFVLVVSEMTSGQNPFSQLVMEHWNTKNGMPNDMVLNVYQTMDGYIWLSGYTGLTRFDGISFTPFNSRNVPQMKTDNIETLLYETKDSTLWIPTPNSGLLSYKNGEFKAYIIDSTSLYISGLTGQDELLLNIGRGKTSYALFDTRDKSIRALTSSEMLQLMLKEQTQSYDVVKDLSGNTWIYSKGFYRLKDGKLTKLTSKEGLTPDRGYYQIYADSRNRVWLVATKGLFLWNGQKFKLYPGMEDVTFVTSGAMSTGMMMEDTKGGIWLGTESGVAYLPDNSNRFLFYPGEEGPLSQAVNNILEDREGNIWFSSTADGLIKLSQSKFVNYSVRDGLNDNRVAAVCAVDTNNYLLATYRKLFRIENGVVEPYSFKDKSLENFKGDPTHLFKDSNGNVWLTFSLGSIIRISSNGEKLIQSKSISQARYVFEDENGKIWFGFGYLGIGCLNQQDEIELLPFPKIDFSPFYISSVRKLQNGNWLVTSFNNGIIVIDRDGNPSYYDDNSGLPTIGVFSSLEDADGTVWLTTQSGITRFKNGEFQNVGFRDGLPENSVFDLLSDNEGYVWFPSNRGLIRAKKQELNNYLDKKIEKINWQVFDDGDGMLNRQCVGARHPAKTPDGKLLFPTFGGLVEVDPAQLKQNTIAPPVKINQVLRDDLDVGLTQNQTLTPGSHRYVFGYSALSFVAPEKVQFKFKLEGYDKDWISAVGDRKAFYTNIPTGDYTFRVIACNNDGVWNETGASYSFRIKPFFWETTLFRISAVVFLLLVVWLIVKWRTQAARKQNEILEAEVGARTSDLHKANKELKQLLENLKSTQAQLVQSEKMASLGELTAGIAHEIQNPLNFVNNFSELNNELLDDLKEAIAKNDQEEIESILKDLSENESKVASHGKRAESIVKGMLLHSRGSSGKKEPTDINALCDEYLRLSYHGFRAKDKSFNADFKLEADENLPKIEVVPQDIGRVLLNLINNAFYAVSEKSKLQVSSYKPQVIVSTKMQGGKIEISVKDNGPGIPEKVKEKIFQPFFTTKPTGQGTGLGLSLSYDIIRANGGEIMVESTENKGTEFLIVIPVSSEII